MSNGFFATVAPACALLASLGLALAASGQEGDKPAAQQFFQKQLAFSLPDGTTSQCETVATVPAGWRLVIEYVSSVARPTAGQHLRSSQVRTKIGAELVFHGLLNQPTGVVNEYCAAQLVRLYADPGTSVAYCADRDAGAGVMPVRATLSGRLLPAQP